MITLLQSRCPNRMVVTLSSCSTADATKQFIFSAQPHSDVRTFVRRVVMCGRLARTFSNGVARQAIQRTASHTGIKRIASVGTIKVIFYIISFCVTSIVNIPSGCCILRIYMFWSFERERREEDKCKSYLYMIKSNVGFSYNKKVAYLHHSFWVLKRPPIDPTSL